ncbi:cAMP phosphodiesterase [Bordetella ansorpii]|uniref:cAMP phosphodiesterase n=1 Tax=Bordetella ansorpii TaxID=288768 RepID=A0A157S8T7_9BORD|nr:metallophosphoesterase [Bordetella ansorpii]SAI66346.1 cAMP phosphodiesterase [Bordetella ansorpii]
MSAAHVTPIDEQPALLIQLTDMHLMDEPHAEMLGVDTEASLKAVLRQAMREMPDAQLVLATGDVAQDGSRGAYRRLRGLLGQLGTTVRCLPGNHDDAAAMHAVLPDWTTPITDVGAWRVVMLDSTVRGSDAGHLDDRQLDLLDQAAATADDRHILVALHHNPVQMDSDRHDTMMVDNPMALFQRLADIPQARVVLWGHVHRQFDRRRHNLRLLASPSTCFQFAVHNGRHTLDGAAPGYRWLKLYRDGSLATGVRRLHPATWHALCNAAQPRAA